jgi:uncharacterized membrane protein
MAGTRAVTASARHRSFAHKLAWLVFVLLLLFATVFVTRTAPSLPSIVAAHFDTAGRANGYMSHDRYLVVVRLLTLGLPLAIVGLLAFVYSRATELKLPNSDYWLAPQRLERTRAFLVMHAVWFGSMLVAFTCFVHWLVLDANAQQPPHLSNQVFLSGVIVFLVCTAAWIGTMMFAFRRPSGE